jgi:uncharacterized repeat protein (TIGR03806 family)
VDGRAFPQLLSETGAFVDAARLEPAPGLLSYDLLAPLWSDGTSKERWIALPELGAVIASDRDAWAVPEGTVLIKHFEMALDERQPEVRRRLETRVLVAAEGGSFYGVTYRWNSDETDAELLLEPETEPLRIIDAEGNPREQLYYYPGARDCLTCHTSTAGSVLGLRSRQLNRQLDYGNGPVNQLVAWSAWGLLDRIFDDGDVETMPRLVDVTDERASLEERVRSYWDSNCSMCHAGDDNGWDARFFTPLPDLGLDQPPQMFDPDLPGALIDPGEPMTSYIYLRSATLDRVLRMPPIGRNRIDEAYLDVLARWIDSL